MSYLEVVQNPIIGELLKRGVSMTLFSDGVILEGFYKSSTISLTANQEGKLFAHSRYGISNNINSMEDLVELNMSWWRYSKGRSSAWEIPVEPWLTLAEELKFITVTRKTVEIVEVK